MEFGPTVGLTGDRRTPPTLIVFWDYDTQWGADRSRLGGGRRTWGALEFPCTDAVLDLHAEWAVPACFAVVGAAARPGRRPYHDPAQIRRIHAAGHEVASHSMRHEWLPALTGAALIETLASSRAAIEDCIGAPVLSFVPPFNQPFDYARAGSISASERREVPGRRTDLPALCRALHATGYRFCRVAYRPWLQRAREWMAGRRLDRPARPVRIEGVTCARVTCPAGFDAPVQSVLERLTSPRDVMIAYGHPHSLHEPGPQHLTPLRSFLRRVRALIDEGRIRVCRPCDLDEVRGRPQAPDIPARLLAAR